MAERSLSLMDTSFHRHASQTNDTSASTTRRDALAKKMYSLAKLAAQNKAWATAERQIARLADVLCCDSYNGNNTDDASVSNAATSSSSSSLPHTAMRRRKLRPPTPTHASKSREKSASMSYVVVGSAMCAFMVAAETVTRDNYTALECALALSTGLIAHLAAMPTGDRRKYAESTARHVYKLSVLLAQQDWARESNASFVELVSLLIHEAIMWHCYIGELSTARTLVVRVLSKFSMDTHVHVLARVNDDDAEMDARWAGDASTTTTMAQEYNEREKHVSSIVDDVLMASLVRRSASCRNDASLVSARQAVAAAFERRRDHKRHRTTKACVRDEGVVLTILGRVYVSALDLRRVLLRPPDTLHRESEKGQSVGALMRGIAHSMRTALDDIASIDDAALARIAPCLESFRHVVAESIEGMFDAKTGLCDLHARLGLRKCTHDNENQKEEEEKCSSDNVLALVVDALEYLPACCRALVSGIAASPEAGNDNALVIRGVISATVMVLRLRCAAHQEAPTHSDSVRALKAMHESMRLQLDADMLRWAATFCASVGTSYRRANELAYARAAMDTSVTLHEIRLLQSPSDAGVQADVAAAMRRLSELE